MQLKRLLNPGHHVLHHVDQLLLRLLTNLLLVTQSTLKFLDFGLQVLPGLFDAQVALLQFLFKHLLESGEVTLQALFDVLDTFKPIFGLELDIVLDRHFFVVNQLGYLLCDLLSAQFRRLKPSLELLLSVLNLLLFLLQLLLLAHSVLVQILIDEVELLVNHNVKALLSLVDDLVELVLEANRAVFVLVELIVFALLYGLRDTLNLLLKSIGSIRKGVGVEIVLELNCLLAHLIKRLVVEGVSWVVLVGNMIESFLKPGLEVGLASALSRRNNAFVRDVS